MVEGMKILRNILSQPALKPYHGGEHFPGAQVKSDADWLDYCRNFGVTIYHPSCTAKMGDGADATLDTQLRFKGSRRSAWSTHPRCRMSFPETPTPP
jgi:choline dehydrogenase-like flavoprotein